MLTEFHIGIDDTDSRAGGCTTYTAAVLFHELLSKGFKITDYPWLVRLNPNIPWKTRGNGSLSLHLLVDEDSLDDIRDLAISIVKKTADLSSASTDPAIVFLSGIVPGTLREFSRRALYDVLQPREAKGLAKSIRADARMLKGTRGLIGALAAVGAELDRCEHTFEIIAYRADKMIGTARQVDRDSVHRMDAKYHGKTFHNLDPETGRVLICPHGPDPVLFGIRGNDPQTLLTASMEIDVHEPVERIMIFRTNQGTNAHLTRSCRIVDLKAYQSTKINGRVETLPQVLQGGHVIFRLRDETGLLDCAAYQPTGPVMRTARELLPGDRIRAYGGIRKRKDGSLTLNLEKIDIVYLTGAFQNENPICVKCAGRCESMGRGQGFRCKKCGLRLEGASKVYRRIRRELSLAAFIPPPRARRHLAKPLDQELCVER